MASAGQPLNSDLPADRHFAITPNDSTDLTITPRVIRIGGSGDIAIRDIAGVDITYAVSDGEVIPIRAVRVLSTGTTATGIVGWY